MGKLKKSLCRLDADDLKKHGKAIVKAVRKGKYICARCARVSNEKSLLCAPVPLKEFAKHGK